MELDFDKEINALLRQEGRGRTITIGEYASPHLDADEIAAFVENAVPEATKQEFIRHFAECDGCRRTLSHTIAIHSEEAEVPAAVIAAPAVEAGLPWYRRLFLFPNLAYVMGGLVVLFGGFIGLSVLLQSGSGPIISQSTANQARPAISAPAAEPMAANSNAAMTSSANTTANAANSAANVPYGVAFPAQSPNADSKDETAAKQAPGTIAPADTDSGAAQPFAAPPPPPAKEAVSTTDSVVTSRKAENLPTAAAEREKDLQKLEPRSMQELSTANRGGPAKMKGPSRNDRNERNIARDGETGPVPEKSQAPGGAASPAERKRVSGRTFEFRQGAWYDTTYRGEGTVNVRRNSDDYRKLDKGLRGIAESIRDSVTVWNGKA